MHSFKTFGRLIIVAFLSLLTVSCGGAPSVSQTQGTPTSTAEPTSTPTPTPFVLVTTEDWILTILKVKRGDSLEWNSRSLTPDGQWLIISGDVRNLTARELRLAGTDFTLTSPQIRGTMKFDRDATGAAGLASGIKSTVSGYSGLPIPAGKSLPFMIVFDVPNVVEQATLSVGSAKTDVALDVEQQAVLMPTTTPTRGPTNTPAPTNTPTPTFTPGPPTDTPLPTNTPTLAPPTATPLPPTEVPTPTPLPSTGDQVDVGEVSYRLEQALDAGQLIASDNQFIDPLRTNGKFVRVRIALMNQGDIAESISADNHLYLYDSEGRQFAPDTDFDTAMILGADNMCIFEDLPPGVTKVCRLIYVVPEDAHGFELEVTNLAFIFKESARISLGF